MQEDNPMKKAFRRIIPILTAVILSLCLALPVSAWDIDRTNIWLQINNAPEGTATIEILVPVMQAGSWLCDTHSITIEKSVRHYETKQGFDNSRGGRGSYEYNEFKNEEKQELVLDENSEIAQYIDGDGFVSISAHTDCIKLLCLRTNLYNDNDAEKGIERELFLRGDVRESVPYLHAEDLESRFSSFKAAYIDEKGNVLGVTDEFEVIREDTQYTFSTNGDKLTLIMNNHDDWFYWKLFWTLLWYVGVPALIVITSLVLFIKSIIFLKRSK